MKPAGGLLLASLLATACTPRRLVLPDTGLPGDTGGPDAACPHLHVSTGDLSWDDASADGTEPQIVTITNLCAGTAPLVISVSLHASGPEVFGFTLEQASLAPGEGAALEVSFTPLDFDTHAGVIEIASNAEEPSSETVILTANTVPDADGDGADSLAAGGDDCDDRDATVFPGAPERWHDGVDNDCDGLTDEIGVDEALTALHAGSQDYLGYRSSLSLGDLDGDGLLDLAAGGIYAGPTWTSQGGVWLLDGGDIGGLDGAIGGYAEAQIAGDYYQNYLGPMATRQGDVDGSGADDLFIAASDRNYQGAGNVAAGVFLDPGDLSGSTPLSEAEITFTGSESLYSLSAGAAFDLDGDGLDEVVYGDWWSSSTFSGEVSVFLGASLAQGGSMRLSADADLVMEGDDVGDSLGCAFGAGDLDDDGYEDLLATAPWSDRGASEGGEVYLVAGGAVLPDSGTASGVARLQLSCSRANGALGYLAEPQVADLDGDGGGDLILSSPGAEAVFVFLEAAGLSGQQDVDDADVVLEGQDIGAFGASLATGALLESGGTDLAVGAPDCINLGTAGTDCEQPGGVFVFAGPELASGHIGVGQAGLIVHGAEVGGLFGASIAVGDLAGDARDELVIAAPGAGSGGEGYIWIFSDPG
ncbi:MAG: MopE-related protein [Pseudomonadota bacterium]